MTTTETIARLVVLLPVLAAVVGLLLARRAAPGAAVAVGTLGLGATAVAAIVLAVQRAGDPAVVVVDTLPALHAGELAVPLHLAPTGPLTVVASVVAGVALAVQAYAAWYLRDDDRLAVFLSTVSLFTAGMLLVALSGDLLLTLVGWEVMGWCSFLLVGHWSRREAARRAAVKAFLVTRLADTGFVLGLVLLASGPRSTDRAEVVAHWVGAGAGSTTAWLAPALLVVGVLGKSAMVPFHDWLPDAMEGPTPASALIHAATMVAAGTVVLAQVFPVLVGSGAGRGLLAVSTSVTMVGAALLALGQSDLKRLLAYSTLSQVALMLSALSVAPLEDGPGAGLFHLTSHAMFKALLFLTLGWLGLAAGGTAAVALRGSARGRPVARVGLGLGLAALAGVPPLVGFWSKEQVLGAAESGLAAGNLVGLLVLLAGLVTVVLTAAYATRAWLVLDTPPATSPTDLTSPTGPTPPPIVSAHPDLPGGLDTIGGGAVGVVRVGRGVEPAPAARAALVVLAAGTVVGGLLALGGLFDLHTHAAWWMAVLTVLLLAGGAYAVLATRAAHPDPASRLGERWVALSDNGLGVDRLYVLLLARPAVALAHLVTRVDDRVVDATVRGAAAGTLAAGRRTALVHRVERSSTALAWVVVGVVAAAAMGVLLW